MQILSVHINRFGPLSDYNMDFASGINLIEGGNEAGKSTLAAFIKFIFYGLSSKSDADDLSERQRYPAWNSSGASGSMILLHKEIKYRVHREFIVGAKGNKSENVIITKADSGEVVAGTPDKLFLGVTEEIFRRSCYIGQTDGSRISGACLNEAIENILFSADEAVNTQRALKRLDEARTMLLHKNQKGGKIFEIRREQDVLLDELNEAKATMAILAERREKAYESKRIVDDKKAKFAAVDAKIKYTEATRRMKNIENIQQLKAKLGEIEEQLSQENGGFSPDRGYYETLCYMGDEYRTAEQEAARLHAEAEVLREKVQGVNPESDNTSDLLNQVEKAKSRGRISVFAGIILALLGAVIFAVFYFELINADVAPYGAATAGAGAMLVFAAVSFINAMLYKRKVRKIFSDNGVSDQKELSALIEGIAHMRAELRSMEEKLAQLEGGHTEQIRLQEEKLDAINAHLLK
ncbi:MAG: AAA family ATPase, partial [Oscillospiraceae bacterium]|nr:AAA family ATPase [Oscillospiraceae bacterium]